MEKVIWIMGERPFKSRKWMLDFDNPPFDTLKSAKEDADALNELNEDGEMGAEYRPFRFVRQAEAKRGR